MIAGIDPERLPGLFMDASAFVAGSAATEYLHWDKLRHLEPPAGLTLQEWWLALKLARRSGQRTLPLTDTSGLHFTFTLPDELLRLLHVVDQRCSGEIAMPDVVTADSQARQHYLVNSLMEEAIRSSQLEGATTSRRVAKELLSSGRLPRDRGERMISNNYIAMRFMRESMGDELTPAAVLELHRILTEGTLDDPDASGRLQRPDEERVAVVDREDGAILHRPPPAEQLPDRLQAMCDFANARGDGDRFIHPVVRGVLLHFWLAYDHPFEDGNGRVARVLFFWYLRTHGYWLVEYLSISKILREAPGQYTRSFLLTETDDRDTTYFLLHQLHVVERAIEQLHRYLQRKVSDVRSVERLIRGSSGFNHRQLALLSDALRNGDRVYTFGGHAASHGVTHETARTDLRDLAHRGVLDVRRAGRQYRFLAPPDLADRLKALGEPGT
jgi:Fic family protein